MMIILHSFRTCRFFALFLLCLLIAAPTALLAQNSHQPARIDQSSPADSRLAAARSQLAGIAASIQDRREHLEELRQQWAAAQTASEKTELEQEIAELEELIQASRNSFESIATGGVDSTIFRDHPDQPFNWQQDLFQIIEPFLDQLKRMTETPRTIERLSSEISDQESRLTIINRALEHIASVKAGVEDDVLGQRLLALERAWQQRGADVQLELELLRQRLLDLREKQTSFWTMVHQGLLNFITGRGVVLVLAFFAAGTVWFVMQALPRVIKRRRDEQALASRKPHFRLMTYGYQALCGLLSLIALLLVLYVSGDWLLLGIALIILIFIAIGFKNYLPKFMTEARLLLDMGPVREGERVIYNGIPWQVQSLNMYSTLVNPELQGGTLRMPLSALADMLSRPVEPEEPWFPTRKNDFVLLADGTFGQILLQTPEVVQMKVVGSTRTFATDSFLGSSPRNLSRDGFGFAVTFGIDYQHQAICLEEVPGIFDAAVTAALKASPVADSLEAVLVDFKEAGASSLDYLIFVNMSGQAAGSYWAVGRIIQQACVRVCNERGWIIPFTQLTVHQGDGFDALRNTRK
ncbi:MAG TPA: hypothetical protein ENN39_05995 [Desulfonatronum sp.]|nr:hypothetical protein [Desulfonatronum sp.]